MITPILKMQVQIRCFSQLLIQSGGSLLPALPSRYCGSRHRTEINQPLNHVNPASNPHPRLGGKHRDIAKIIGNVLAAYGFPMNGILTMQSYSLQALLVGDGYSDAEVADAQAAFHDYAQEVSMFNGTVVVVRQGVVRTDGVAMLVIGELIAHFQGRTASEGLVDRVLAI